MRIHFYPMVFIYFFGCFHTYAQEGSSKIQWLTFEQAFLQSKQQPKKVFIEVYTDWCGWCKVMDRQTFSDPFIANYINLHFYPVKLNAEQRDPITFNGKIYQFVQDQGRGYHELAIFLMNGRMTYPTLVFLDESFQVLQPIPGFRKPEELDMILKYFGENFFKKFDFDSFSRSYLTPVKSASGP